jgi:acyl-coenzyme A synthetase/AMP-(fatty) acid ligase
VGVPDELYIAGQGVGRGYLDAPDKTRKAFVENPFEPGRVMYRTGDLVRWLPDGNIEFIDRMDFQVKIRGFRVEIGEIERTMLEYPGMGEAIVTARQECEGGMYLCGYFTAGDPVDENGLREFWPSGCRITRCPDS